MITDNETTSNSNDQHTEQYQRIGSELARARRDAGLSRQEVSSRLRLPGLTIEDLESGRVERMPVLYRRGYISNYARLVGLDPAELMGESVADELPELREVLPVKSSLFKFDRYLKVATYLVVTIAIVGPMIYFFIQGGSRLLDREPAVGPVELAATEMERSVGREGVPLADASMPDEVDARPAAERGHISASALPLKPRTLREIEEEQQGVELPGPIAEPGAMALNRLELELLGDSWVEVHDSDGQRLEYDLLRAGQQRSYEGKAPFRLLLGRASAVSLTLDGEEVAFEGHDRSDLARIEISASGEVRR